MKCIKSNSHLTDILLEAYRANIVTLKEVQCIIACVDSVATKTPPGFRLQYGTYNFDTLDSLCGVSYAP